jgi:small-conductance mechanosensitive channel
MIMEELKKIGVPLVIGFGTLVLLSGLRTLLQLGLRRSPLSSNQILARVIRSPSLLWCVALALYAAVETSQLTPKYLGWVHTAIQIVLIFSVTLVFAGLLEGLVTFHLSRIQSPIATSGLVHGMIRGVVVLIGLMIILERLGVHIEPLLTALGVGGLAVSLALQDTLANLFAGISLLIDRALKVGDRVKLDTGQEGEIIDIGWRTTRIQLSGEDLLVLPNTKLAQGISVRRKP